MSAGITARSSLAEKIDLRPLALPVALLVVLLLCVPLAFAAPANMTSDESLYLAEAYNIAHGDGFTYPSGEPITQRAPLYPLLLAPALKLGGVDAAYHVAGAIVIVNALIVFALAWRLGGALAGAIAGGATAASAYVSGLGTTLFVDPLQCTFMLLCVAALWRATNSGARWWIAGGVSLGLAFLVKESAIQWGPIAVIACLAVPSMRTRDGATGALLFGAAFAATVAPWWAWVWWHTSELYLIGGVSAAAVALIVAAAVATVLLVVGLWRWPSLSPDLRSSARRAAVPAAIAITLLWGGFMLYGLTAYSTWPYPNDYLTTVPRYLRTVAPQAQPYFLLAGAWLWLAWRVARGDEAAKLIAIAAALFVPFALFAANRNLQLRDALPLVYLSYLVFGLAVADGLRRLRNLIDLPSVVIMGSAVVALAGFSLALQQAATFQLDNSRATPLEVGPGAWDSYFVRDEAEWMRENLPEGANVLSSRLYFSSLHVRSGGRFDIRQMPTVRVDVDARRPGLLDARSNLFRWEDAELRETQPGERWLHLKQFPGKEYWVGLAQDELLAYVAAHDIEYVVLTGEDVAFSSIAYAAYFSGHPAFTLVHHAAATAADQFFVYEVDRSKLRPVEHSTTIGPASFTALQRETGISAEGLATALGTPLRVTDSDMGLSQREQWAAVAGTDLGAAER